MTYLVYENGDLLGNFMSLSIAKFFAESWRKDSPIHVDIVDSSTGEVINTLVNGSWEN